MTSGESLGCVIVSGMPGAGKSTVTALAARLLPRAAQVKGDDVNLWDSRTRPYGLTSGFTPLVRTH